MFKFNMPVIKVDKDTVSEQAGGLLLSTMVSVAGLAAVLAVDMLLIDRSGNETKTSDAKTSD